jgi:hypothetical protein
MVEGNKEQLDEEPINKLWLAFSKGIKEIWIFVEAAKT